MKGLILNNLYSVGKSIKSSSFLTVVAVVLLLMTDHSMALKAAAFLPFVLIPVHAFEILKYDAMSGWNKYEIILPVTRKQIVESKYITFLLLFIYSILLVICVALTVHMFLFPTMNVVFFNSLLRGMGLIICIATAVYPLTYLLGTEKSDSIMIGSVFFSFVIFFVTTLLLQLFIGEMEDFDEMFSVIFLSVSILIFCVSYLISLKLYKNREF